MHLNCYPLGVQKKHCDKAISEIYGSVLMEFLRSCSLMEKVVMVALMIDIRANKKSYSTAQVILSCVCTALSDLHS